MKSQFSPQTAFLDSLMIKSSHLVLPKVSPCAQVNKHQIKFRVAGIIFWLSSHTNANLPGSLWRNVMLPGQRPSSVVLGTLWLVGWWLVVETWKTIFALSLVAFDWPFIWLTKSVVFSLFTISDLTHHVTSLKGTALLLLTLFILSFMVQTRDKKASLMFVVLLFSCVHSISCFVGRLVGLLVRWSLFTKHATYGDRPCLLDIFVFYGRA